MNVNYVEYLPLGNYEAGIFIAEKTEGKEKKLEVFLLGDFKEEGEAYTALLRSGRKIEVKLKKSQGYKVIARVVEDSRKYPALYSMLFSSDSAEVYRIREYVPVINTRGSRKLVYMLAGAFLGSVPFGFFGALAGAVVGYFFGMTEYTNMLERELINLEKMEKETLLTDSSGDL